MPTTTLMPLPKQQFLTSLGTPLIGGKVYTYAAGTSTPKPTYSDAEGTIEQENPIPLNLRGEPDLPIFWSGNYRIEVRNALGGLIYTVDNFNTDPAGVWGLADEIVANITSSSLKFSRPDSPLVVRTVQSKLLDYPTAADFGATADSDSTVTLQKYLDSGFGMLNDTSYSITSPLKIPALSYFGGTRAGTAFVGKTNTVKRSIKKSTYSTVTITNFENPAISNTVDCIAYTEPAWIGQGQAFPQNTTIENQSWEGGMPSPTGHGLFVDLQSNLTIRNWQCTNVVNALYMRTCFASVFENIHTNGKIVWAVGGTSCTFTNVATGSSATTTGGWSLVSLIYSVFNGCWNDGTTDTGWRLNGCKGLVFNGCGIENGSANTANSGTAFAFDGNNDITLNGFVNVPTKGQRIPPYTVGFDNMVTFNQGTASFPVEDVNCPDIYIWGNGSTVIFNDYQFLNGSRNNPIVQFGPNVTTSVVIVRVGTNVKTYRSTGTGNTVVEAERDSGTFTPVLKFGGTDIPVVSSGSWQKNGKVVTVSGRISQPQKGASTGAATISGWPAGFVPLGDTEIGFSLVAGITGGPISGVIDAGSPLAGLTTKLPTGDGTASDGNFTNSSLLRFSFTFSIA